jgi:hypothetical protein
MALTLIADSAQPAAPVLAAESAAPDLRRELGAAIEARRAADARSREAARRCAATDVDQIKIEADRTTDEVAKARLLKAVDNWKKTAAHYNDEPDTKEGRKQLAERAKEAEERRELALARYHQYEFASAAFQIGIVLASAYVITGVAALAWLSGVVGILGLGFMVLGLWVPHALRLA